MSWPSGRFTENILTGLVSSFSLIYSYEIGQSINIFWALALELTKWLNCPDFFIICVLDSSLREIPRIAHKEMRRRSHFFVLCEHHFFFLPTANIKRLSRGKRKEETCKVRAQVISYPFLFSPPKTYKSLNIGRESEKRMDQEMNRESIQSKGDKDLLSLDSRSLFFISFSFFWAAHTFHLYLCARLRERKEKRKVRAAR